MVVHNEYLGWEIQWPQTMEDTLTTLAVQDEDKFDGLRSFVHDTFPNVDTFHTDCVTFDGGFSDKDEARAFEKELKKKVIAWLNAHA